MAEVKMADIVQLRKMTSAGMMDCKSALIEAEGDIDRAVEIIREKGKLVASKRADRTATEGVVVARVSDDRKKAYMVCLACETDFVAKNEEFVKSAGEIMDVAFGNDVADMEGLLATRGAAGMTVADMVTQKSGQTGEKVELPFYGRIEAAYCAAYIHTNSKLGAIVGFNREVPYEVAMDVAMQATAMAPVSIDETDCPADILAKELEIGREQARQEGKPEDKLDMIAQGKVKKYLKDNTLLNQTFVKDGKMSVADYVRSADKEATVVAYMRFSLQD